jgi:glycosyltransferase involved in cell wall biosynthesis
MRIGVDAWNLASDRRGMGRYVRRILQDWQDRGDLDVTLLVRNPEEERAVAAEFDLPTQRPRYCAYDAIWYPWNAMRFGVRGARSVVTLHDAFAFTLPHASWIARMREQSPIRRAVRDADGRAVNSRWSAQEIARVFRCDPALFTVVHPVADPFFEPVGAPESPPFVFVVAGPDERKNLATLFDAFGQSFPNRDVTLVVGGALRDADEARLARAAFRFERTQPDDNALRELYSGALAVAVPSSQEGYGLMVVEAMACGAPVIAADAAALPEACDGAAWLIPPFDTDAWAQALTAVTRDATVRETLRARSLERAARIDRTEPSRLTLELLMRPSVPAR